MERHLNIPSHRANTLDHDIYIPILIQYLIGQKVSSPIEFASDLLHE
jgi:hypothetical protein